MAQKSTTRPPTMPFNRYATWNAAYKKRKDASKHTCIMQSGGSTANAWRSIAVVAAFALPAADVDSGCCVDRHVELLFEEELDVVRLGGVQLSVSIAA